MPYIKKSRRDALYSDSTTDYDDSVQNAGELNFWFTEMALDYVKSHGLSYQTLNDIVGALDNCKDEFRRRIQHPYENQKMKENGDIFKPVLHLLKTVKTKKKVKGA